MLGGNIGQWWSMEFSMSKAWSSIPEPKKYKKEDKKKKKKGMRLESGIPGCLIRKQLTDDSEGKESSCEPFQAEGQF
jgi:hypothetical protein